MPKIVSVNEANAAGTHLQGYIEVSYQRLVDAFGEPIDGDGYKVDAEWVIQFADGEVGTIYNWKNGINYLGHDGMDVEHMKDWHIGGRSKKVVRYLENHLLNPWPPAFEDIRLEAEF